jgi:four helix bundle protein
VALERFEDTHAWKKARELTKAIYAVTSGGAFSRDRSLCDQVRRASISIMSNFAEGFERDGNREFVQFLTLAKGSAGEVRAQLYVALDADYLAQEDFDRPAGEAIEVSRLIAGFIRYLRETEYRGSKFQRRNGIAEAAATWNLEL